WTMALSIFESFPGRPQWRRLVALLASHAKRCLEAAVPDARAAPCRLEVPSGRAPGGMLLCDRQTGMHERIGENCDVGLIAADRAIKGGAAFWKMLAWIGLLLAGIFYMIDPLESASFSTICFTSADSSRPDLFVENAVKTASTQHDSYSTNADG